MSSLPTGQHVYFAALVVGITGSSIFPSGVDKVKWVAPSPHPRTEQDMSAEKHVQRVDIQR